MSIWDIAGNIEKLTALWIEGLSASKIATTIGGCTRNAIIGKAHRLGLTGYRKPVARNPVKTPPKKPPLKGQFLFVDTGEREAPIPPETFNLPSDERDGISILEIRPGYNCRAVINVENRRYCGLPTDEGDSFCPAHKRVYYYQPRPERRNQTFGQ